MVEYLKANKATADALREQMRGIYDLERISSRASYGNISPKDCRCLGDSLTALGKVIYTCKNDIKNHFITETADKIADFGDLAALLCSAIDP